MVKPYFAKAPIRAQQENMVEKCLNTPEKGEGDEKTKEEFIAKHDGGSAVGRFGSRNGVGGVNP